MLGSIQVTIHRCENGYYVRLDMNNRQGTMKDFICQDADAVAKLTFQTLCDMEQEEKQEEMF